MSTDSAGTPRATLGLLAAAGVCAALTVGVALSSASDYALIPSLLTLVLLCASAVPVSPWLGTLAAAALGLGASAYLYSLKMAASAGPSACSIDATFDCDRVNSSPWSELGGVPIALLGAGYYAALLVAGLLARTDEAARERFLALSALLAVPAVVYSAFLGWISEQMGVFCIVCITMYLANAVLLWAGAEALRRSGRGWLDGAIGLVTSPQGLTMAGVLGLVLLLQLGGSTPTDEVAVPVRGDPGAASQLRSLYDAPAGPVRVSGDEPILGAPDAPVSVVVFADFGCPHCARAEEELRELVAARPDVNVKFKYFPLSGECNPALPKTGAGQERCTAAIAAECARRQGRFWELSHLLFENQGFFAPDQVRSMAEQAGVDLAAFDACMTGPDAVQTVSRSGAAGGEAQIQGTPALFVVGLVGDRPVEALRGARGILALLEARDDGVSLPSPPSP